MNVYGGIAPAPPLGINFKGKVTLIVFFNVAREDSLKMVDIALMMRNIDKSVQVIGIHCPRFAVERDDKRLKVMLKMNHIDFPVYSDQDRSIRKSYLIKNWPAIALVDPTGSLVWCKEEPFHPGVLRPVVNTILSMGRSMGGLVAVEASGLEGPDLEMEIMPSKICLNGRNLFVVDEIKKCLIWAELDRSGEKAVVKKIYNSPLSWPKGLCLNGEDLYIADRGSASILKLSTTSSDIEPIEMRQSSNWLNRVVPSELVLMGELVYFYGADTNRIWLQSLNGLIPRPFAGKGEEGMDDGGVVKASLGQAESLISDGKYLYFCDSYSNSIRFIDPASAVIRTLSGVGPSIYGLRDGYASEALFQRPTGLAFKDNLLLVVDSYNDRIRVINLDSFIVSTLYGEKRWQSLFTPSDIAVREDQIYISDSGNGRVLLLNKDEDRARVVEFKGLSEHLK